jgi:hypothetical protein
MRRLNKSKTIAIRRIWTLPATRIIEQRFDAPNRYARELETADKHEVLIHSFPGGALYLTRTGFEEDMGKGRAPIKGGAHVATGGCLGGPRSYYKGDRTNGTD